MRTKESSPGDEDGARERDRALERTLRDALALAVSKKVADQALRQARNKAHGAGRRDFRRVAGHMAGYGTLLTYILAPAADPETVRKSADEPEDPHQQPPIISARAMGPEASHRFGNRAAVGWT